MAIPDDRLLLYARLVAGALAGILLSILVLASVLALLLDDHDPGQLAPIVAIIAPALVGLAGYALGLPRIIGK